MAKKKTTKKAAKRKSTKKAPKRKSAQKKAKSTQESASPKKPINPLTIIICAAAGLLVLYLIMSTLSSDAPQTLTAEQESVAKQAAQEITNEIQEINAYLADDDPSVGNPDAPITIVKFSDYECPHCAKAAQGVVKKIKETYVADGTVRFVLRDFPLESHRFARLASMASECAHEQGKFWEYHDLLFENQNHLYDRALKKYAADLGLDTAQFDECLDSEKYGGEVDKDLLDGVNEGVTGTPTFFVNGYKIAGAQPYEVFEKMFNALLAAYKDSPFELTIITDADCELCETSIDTVLTDMQTFFFPTAQVRVVQADSAEAKALIAQHGITNIPAYVFDGSVTETTNFHYLKDGFVQSGSSYVLSEQLANPVQEI